MDAHARQWARSRRSDSTFRRLFVDHPRSLGESYWEHQTRALSFGSQLVAAGAACMIHALIPAAFARTASDAVRRLHLQLSDPRRLGKLPLNAREPFASSLAHRVR
jgi:hypothetical protein